MKLKRHILVGLVTIVTGATGAVVGCFVAGLAGFAEIPSRIQLVRDLGIGGIVLGLVGDM